MEKQTEKIKHFTMSNGDSTLYSTDPTVLLDHVEIELQNLKDDDEPMEFSFGIVYMTESEINELGEFDGF